MRKRNTVVTVMVFAITVLLLGAGCHFWIDEFGWPELTHLLPNDFNKCVWNVALSLSLMRPLFISRHLFLSSYFLLTTLYEYKFSMSIRSIMSLLSNYSFFLLLLLSFIFTFLSSSSWSLSCSLSFFSFCSCTHWT